MQSSYYIPEVRALADLIQFRTGWLLTRINVPQVWRGQGYGSRLLNLVLAAADTEGADLYLEIVPSGPLTFPLLEAWYARAGFRLLPDGLYYREPLTRGEEVSHDAVGDRGTFSNRA